MISRDTIGSPIRYREDGSAQPALKATKVNLHAFMKYRRENPEYDDAVRALDVRKKENKRFK